MPFSLWQILRRWFEKPEPEEEPAPKPIPRLPAHAKGAAPSGPGPGEPGGEGEAADPTVRPEENADEIRRIVAQIVAQDLEFDQRLSADASRRREIVLKQLLSQFQLPSLASIANSLQQSISDEDFDINEIVRNIEADASLAAQVLKMANSAFMRGATEVESLHEAALQMGSRTLRQIIFSVRVINTANQLAPDFDWTHLWKHNFAVSVIAVDLQTIFGIESRLTSGIGLIHDIGKVILSDLFPGEYAAVVQRAYQFSTSMGAQEQKFLGITHEEVGAQYVVHNRFPSEIQEALLYQNAPAQAPTYGAAAAILQLANYFAKLHGLGYSGDRSYLEQSYEKLEGWQVLLTAAGAEQRDMIERYEGYLRASLRSSLAKARYQVNSMFSDG